MQFNRKTFIARFRTQSRLSICFEHSRTKKQTSIENERIKIIITKCEKNKIKVK